MDFALIATDIIGPEVTEITETEVFKNEAKIILGTSEICTVYWMLAFYGADAPKFEEIKYDYKREKLLQRLNYSNPIFGFLNVGRENRVTIQLSNLAA